MCLEGDDCQMTLVSVKSMPPTRIKLRQTWDRLRLSYENQYFSIIIICSNDTCRYLLTNDNVAILFE